MVREAIEQAPERDPGIVAATLTYSTAESYRDSLTRYFQDEQNRNFLLKTMYRGLRLEGLSMRPPRFVMARDPVAVHRTAGITFDSLTRRLPRQDLLVGDRFDLAGLVLRLERAIPAMPKELQEAARQVVLRAGAGDLTWLELGAAARSAVGHGSPDRSYEGLLERSAGLLREEQQAHREV